MASKGISLNSFNAKDLDAKFAKASKDDIRAMTGTGMEPKKKRTVKKKKTAKKG